MVNLNVHKHHSLSIFTKEKKMFTVEMDEAVATL
jgi:hypothetical protein